MHCFGTPDLLECDQVPAHGIPISPGIEFATSWEFPSRAALLAAAEDAAPGRFYPRYGHPAGMLAEAALARLEGAEGSVTFASGMAAISGVFLAFLSEGERLALSNRTYGGTVAIARDLLPRMGIVADFFDPFEEAAVDAALARGPKLVHVESPVNPTGRVLDLAWFATRAHDAGALLSVDATFMPPPFQRTLAHGADLAMHSATKFLGGHTDLLAGVVSGGLEPMAKLERFRRVLGPVLSPEGAWRLHRSLKTLDLRVRRQCETALELARWLDGPGRELGVREVHCPGLEGHPDRALAEQTIGLFGAVFSFEPESEAAATRIYDAFRRFRRGVSLGGVESTVSMPVDTSHHMLSREEFASLGFGPAAIRLAVGLEPAPELRDDLEHALREGKEHGGP